MNEKEWNEKAIKVFKAIIWNVEHPSPMRNPLGGNEIEMIRDLIREYNGMKE